MKWQPIETAPQDGTYILGYGEPTGNNEPCVGIIYYKCENEYEEGFDWEHDCRDYYASHMNPTHWVPLPDTPNKDENND